MTNSNRATDEFWRLTNAACDETLDEADLAQLERKLVDDPRRQDLFLGVCQLHAELQLAMTARRAIERVKAVREAAREPAVAPVAPPAVGSPRGRTIPLTRLATYFSQPLRFSLLVATVTLCSLVLTTAQFPMLSPAAPEPAPPVVVTREKPPAARLGRTRAAQWNDTEAIPFDQLQVGQELALQAGWVEIHFERGAKALLEGPARLRIDSPNSARLLQGALTAQVPRAARGFTVITPRALVVDLGTEFGVRVGVEDELDVQVFSGGVRIVPQDASGLATVQTLVGGEAAWLPPNRPLERLAAARAPFIRRFSELRRLNLADLLTRDGGAGGADRDVALDQLSGRYVTGDIQHRVSAGAFWPVPESPFIEGVFAPRVAPPGGLTQIASRGLEQGPPLQVWLPATGGEIWDYIKVKANLDCFATLNGLDYDMDPDHTMIALHANAGLTFDLRAIEAAHLGYRAAQFTTVVGLANPRGSAAYRIYVDGELRATRELAAADALKAFTVDLALPPRAQFLTLIATDQNDGIGSDQIVFGDPQLVLAESLTSPPPVGPVENKPVENKPVEKPKSEKSL